VRSFFAGNPTSFGTAPQIGPFAELVAIVDMVESKRKRIEEGCGGKMIVLAGANYAEQVGADYFNQFSTAFDCEHQRPIHDAANRLSPRQVTPDGRGSGRSVGRGVFQPS